MLVLRVLAEVERAYLDPKGHHFSLTLTSLGETGIQSQGGLKKGVDKLLDFAIVIRIPGTRSFLGSWIQPVPFLCKFLDSFSSHSTSQPKWKKEKKKKHCSFFKRLWLCGRHMSPKALWETLLTLCVDGWARVHSSPELVSMKQMETLSASLGPDP